MKAAYYFVQVFGLFKQLTKFVLLQVPSWKGKMGLSKVTSQDVEIHLEQQSCPCDKLNWRNPIATLSLLYVYRYKCSIYWCQGLVRLFTPRGCQT